jgi:predicted transcriptional regulator
MIIEIINKLLESGELDQLIEAKIIRSSIKKKRADYLFFNNEMLITKDKPTAVTNTSDALNRSERTVYKSINLMEMGKLKTGKATSKKQR